MALNRGCTYREQIGPGDAGRSVAAHLAARYRHSTVDEWTARLTRREIELEGAPASGDEVLAPGQQLLWHRPPWDEPDVPLHFDVLYEDADVLAVSKPSGLPTMPAGGFLDHTLLARVHERYPGARPLHRLGRHTSGVVLFARTHESARALSLLWREKRVVKDYRALVTGQPAWDSLEITATIGRVPHPVLGSVFAADAAGRPSHSLARVVERRAHSALCDVRIMTGRPHQIRIHLSWAGHPLAGDPLYAPGGVPRARDPGLPGDGGYLLHAHRVGCLHPTHGGELTIEAPLPDALVSAVERQADQASSTSRTFRVNSARE